MSNEERALMVLTCGKCKASIWRVVTASQGHTGYVECKLCHARYGVNVTVL